MIFTQNCTQQKRWERFGHKGPSILWYGVEIFFFPLGNHCRISVRTRELATFLFEVLVIAIQKQGLRLTALKLSGFAGALNQFGSFNNENGSELSHIAGVELVGQSSTEAVLHSIIQPVCIFISDELQR